MQGWLTGRETLRICGAAGLRSAWPGRPGKPDRLASRNPSRHAVVEGPCSCPPETLVKAQLFVETALTASQSPTSLVSQVMTRTRAERHINLLPWLLLATSGRVACENTRR